MPQLTLLNTIPKICLRQKYASSIILRNTDKIIFRNKSTNTTKKKTASSVYRAMNIFDRSAKKMQRERSAQREDYHLAEYIKEEIGWRTADRVFDIKRTFKNAVELGAGRGYVSRHFLPDSVEKVTLCDTSQTHLDKAIVGDGVQAEKIVMDEENIDSSVPIDFCETAIVFNNGQVLNYKFHTPLGTLWITLSGAGSIKMFSFTKFPENSIDLIVSSLSLHWVNDLPGCLDRIMNCLQPDGVFMACVFGGDTLLELRQALQLAETERLGGVWPHISPFTRVRDIGGLLNAAGFTLQTVDVDSLCMWYPSAWHVMRDLRALGESNAAHNRPLRLDRQVQFAAAAIYDEMYGKDFPKHDSRGVPATYQIINFLGWKPDPSQPKPMGRGTGEMSLKDLHRIDEVIQDTKKIKLTEDDMK